MARELGLSPERFSSYGDRKEEPWKLSLTEFIESLYQKRFNRSGPEVIKTMEQIAAEYVAKRVSRKTPKKTLPSNAPSSTNQEPMGQEPTNQSPTDPAPTAQSPRQEQGPGEED